MPDLAALPGEQERLLLVAALGEGAAAREAWLTVARGLDIDVVAHETHGLFGRLAENLRSMHLEPEVMPRLDGVRKRMWATNAGRVRRVMGARAALGSAGVTAEPTGGLAVLLRLGDPAIRPLVDAELWVRADDVERAVATLEAAGWKATVRRRDGWLLDLCSVTLVRPDEPRGVTLRWHAAGWPYAGSTEEALTTPTGEQACVPGPGALLAWTLIEGYRLWGYNPTRRYADAMLLARAAQAGDWDDLERITRERRAAAVVRAGLAALQDSLATPVPAATTASVAALADGGRGPLREYAEERSGTAAAFLRRTQGMPPMRAVTSLPTFLREVWDVEPGRSLPGAAAHRLAARRRTRTTATTDGR